MMLRHLVVHIDSSERCAVRLELAVDLAQRFDATLPACSPRTIRT
jgi:nucleotide-binding universal stress UspA family protein